MDFARFEARMRRPAEVPGKLLFPMKIRPVCCLAGLGACLLLGVPAGEALAASAPKLRVDAKALDRSTPGVSYAPVIKRIVPSVVSITVTARGGSWTHPFLEDPALRRLFRDRLDDLNRMTQPRELGSGVIVTEDGYILTNSHVVADGDEIEVALNDGKTRYKAKLIGNDPQTDVAVLKVEATGLPTVAIGNSDQLEVGDVVIAIGNPFNLGQTVTSGIISGLRRGDLSIGRVADYEDFIQTDAAINPGNSGGALVDALGRLIGINTWIVPNSGGGNQGLGFAIPINLARNVLERIIADGRVRRGYIGVLLAPLTPEVVKELNLPTEAGALITSVQPNTPGARAGLRARDVITGLNGKPISDMRAFRLAVSQMTPGTKVTVKLLRGGEEKTLSMTLEELPGLATRGRSAPPAEEETAEALLDDLGLGNLDRQARRRFGLPSSLQGVLIRTVSDDSPASAVGLRVGEVIVEVNREPVASVSEARAAARKVTNGTLLLRVYSNSGEGSTRYVALEKAEGK